MLGVKCIEAIAKKKAKMYPKLLVLLLVFFINPHSYQASDPDPVHDFCIATPDAKTPCKNPAEATQNDFIFSGMKSAGIFTDTGLATIVVNSSVCPGLNTLGMSFVRADLKVGGINPPHIHPRATEIAYVTQGRVYAGFVDTTNRVFAKVIEQGEVMVFPRGLMHFQMNVGRDPATLFLSLNSQEPGNQKIVPAAFGSGIDENLLQKAFGLKVLRRSLKTRESMETATISIVP